MMGWFGADVRAAGGLVGGFESGRLAIFLALLLVLALPLQLVKLSYFDLSWLALPEKNELYLSSLSDGEGRAVVFSSSAIECLLCGGRVRLEKGENRLALGGCGERVKLICGRERDILILSFEPLRYPAAVDGALALTLANKTARAELNITQVRGTGRLPPGGKHEQELTWLIDNRAVRSDVYSFGNGSTIAEKFEVPYGKHTIAVASAGKIIAEKEYELGKEGALSALLMLAPALLLSLRLRKNDALADMLLFFGLLASLLALNFQLISLGVWEYALPIVSVVFAVVLHTRHHKEGAADWGAHGHQGRLGQLHMRHRKGRAVQKEADRYAVPALACSAALALFVLAANLFISDLTVWSAYYIRHANEAYMRGSVLYGDALSYLGRDFTYPPAFFGFAASIARMMPVDDFDAMRLPFHIAVAFLYFASIFLVLRKYAWRERLLGALLLVAQTFILSTSASVALHIFAYALVNIAVAFMPEAHVGGRAGEDAGRAEWAGLVLPIFLLAVAFGSHPTSLLFFPLFLLLSERFGSTAGLEADASGKQWLGRIKGLVLRAGIAMAGALLLSLVFYAPIFLKSGIPYEIIPSKWGYLLTYGFDGLITDFSAAFPLLLATGALAFAEKKTRLLAIVLLLLALGNVFVSYRLNVVLAVFFAFAALEVFKRHLRDDRAFAALMLFPLLSILLFFPLLHSGSKQWCSFWSVSWQCAAPMEYIERYTSGERRVALNPYFGHLEAYLGKRPVLADLYVEYADEGKYLEEERFYFAKEMPDGKRNITLFVLDDINQRYNVKLPADKASPEYTLDGKTKYQRRELESAALGLDKIYENGFMRVYRKR